MIKKWEQFNEAKDEEGFTIVEVKDLIEYLQELDPESRVYLDKDGWSDGETANEVIKNTYLFEHSGKNLFINN